MVELEALKRRAAGRLPADTHEIFERIYRGSMPAIVSGTASNSQIFYSSYLSTYIERDVRSLSESIDATKFIRFVTAVAARCSQMLNVAEIAQDADINQKQAKDWLGILETLGVIFYLHPYSNNLLKRLVKTPKLYFFDSGLVCYLTRWSSAETLEYGAMNGAILENYVVSEIAKTYLNCGKEPYLYYYRDKDAKEGGKLTSFWNTTAFLNPLKSKRRRLPGTELTRVFSLLDKASVPRGAGAIVCMKPQAQCSGPGELHRASLDDLIQIIFYSLVYAGLFLFSKQKGVHTLHNLIITEKPSVARTISKVLGVTTRRDGYLEGGGLSYQLVCGTPGGAGPARGV